MAEQRFLVSYEGDCVRVVVPTPPLIKRMQQMPFKSLNLMELYLERLLLQQETPLRALFEIDADRFRMILVATELGERIETEWPRKKIVAMRKNRYGHGLWIRVQGTLMETYLEDMDDELIVDLSAELWKMIRKYDEPSTDVNPAGIEDTIKPRSGQI
ncbi:hypothetical protein [Gimesia chilikensis]|uniref:Uncharacterized protein n=1 Tax=Gimesia chilikensis TaxID=2605989 RepID=A0A517PR09_9PLAN|nr:hypothetical protein [Gimesia chilikensis]QDT21801.1 hypothetical protein HG66A1_36040 [Gimesia chilikensis]